MYLAAFNSINHKVILLVGHSKQPILFVLLCQLLYL
jgi:hypothetical protein